MNSDYFEHKHHQRGAATLVVSVALLIGVTLLVLFAVRVGVQDQRISGNEVRHKVSFANAEAGTDAAAAFLRANVQLLDGADASWASCTGSTVFPCDITGAESVYASTTVDASGAIQSLTPTISSENANSNAYLVKTSDTTLAVGTGTTPDATGFSVVQVAYVQKSFITPGEIPPIMAPTLNLNGNFTIVADPNNGPGTTGVPISGWTSSNTSGTGSWQTCNAGEFRDGNTICTEEYDASDDWGSCACTKVLSNKDLALSDMIDIYQEDPSTFPQPLNYVFGENATVDTVRDDIKANGLYFPGDCSALSQAVLASAVASGKKPWVFVEGACNVPEIGTDTLPVILVVNGKMTINANTDAWGLLVSLTEVKSNGAAIIHGSLVADAIADISNGGYKQVYDEDLLEALADDTINTDIGKLQYSWRDWQ